MAQEKCQKAMEEIAEAVNKLTAWRPPATTEEAIAEGREVMARHRAELEREGRLPDDEVQRSWKK